MPIPPHNIHPHQTSTSSGMCQERWCGHHRLLCRGLSKMAAPPYPVFHVWWIQLLECSRPRSLVNSVDGVVKWGSCWAHWLWSAQVHDFFSGFVEDVVKWGSSIMYSSLHILGLFISPCFSLSRRVHRGCREKRRGYVEVRRNPGVSLRRILDGVLADRIVNTKYRRSWIIIEIQIQEYGVAYKTMRIESNSK